MTLPTAAKLGAPPMGGASPMQINTSTGMGIHGQFHATPQQVSTPQPGVQAPVQHGTQTPQHQYGMRTPNFGMTLGRAVIGPEVELSGKHNGMCRYLARLLRPLWNQHIIYSRLPTRNEPEEQVRGIMGGKFRGGKRWKRGEKGGRG